MPHKRNPISSENICGLSRIIKASYEIALDNNILWHERDISHSSNERIYLPDDISLIIYIGRRLNRVLKNLVVNEENMIKNIDSTYGVIFSGKVMNYIIEHKDISREEIYDLDQKLAFEALEKLINWGWIDSIYDIYRLSEHSSEWKRKPGFGVASVNKILDRERKISLAILNKMLC